MEFTKIPQLQHSVSRIGLGTWAMGGSLWGDADEKESIQTIHAALDQGINFIDTAPGYGFGRSEEVVGKAIKLYGRRSNIIIATKCGLNLKEETNVYRDSRAESIMEEVEGSLRRLQVDYIDLYQVHWPDPHTAQAETAETLLKLRNQGKIRAIGVSNYDINLIEEFAKVVLIDTLQNPFNIFERESENLLKYCLEKQWTFIGYSALCRGLLTGTLKEDQEFEDLRKNFDPKFKKPHFPQYLVCTGRLQQWVADKHKHCLTALAIRWSLDKGVNIALWGARKPNELDPIKEILDWRLTHEDFREIDKIISETITDPIGPQFMSPPIKQHIRL